MAITEQYEMENAMNKQAMCSIVQHNHTQQNHPSMILA